MARKRDIDPAFFRHRELFECERSSGLPIRVAFAGLWCVADREGRFRWRPWELKLDILPYDDCDFGAVLSALEAAGFIRRYVVDGQELGDIPAFAKYQHPHPKEAPSKLLPCNYTESRGITRKATEIQPEIQAFGDTSLRRDKPSDTASESASIPADLPPVSVPYLTQCVIALNAGLAENRHLGGQFREVSASEVSGQVTWEAEGILLDTAVATVRKVAANYRPKGHSRQPWNLRYFDGAVRDAAFGKKRPDGPRQPDRWVDPHRDRRPGQLKTSLKDLLPAVVGQIAGPTQGAA